MLGDLCREGRGRRGEKGGGSKHQAKAPGPLPGTGRSAPSKSIMSVCSLRFTLISLCPASPPHPCREDCRQRRGASTMWHYPVVKRVAVARLDLPARRSMAPEMRECPAHCTSRAQPFLMSFHTVHPRAASASATARRVASGVT